MKRACSNCGVDLKKRMKNIACVKCHAPMCEKCGSICKDCIAIKEDKKMITDYFRDKYASRSPLLQNAGTGFVTVFFLFLLMLPAITALEFRDETVRSDLTSFEWCFTPEWEDAALYKDKLNVYTDDFGCDVTKKNLYAVTPVTVKDGDCTWVNVCSNDPVYDAKNDTYNVVPNCSPQKQCKDKVIDEYYDLEKTDYLFPKGSRICYVAQRKASTAGVCDMNFNIEVDGKLERAVDYGKLWWDTTWANKRALTASVPSGATEGNYTLEIELSSYSLGSDFNYSVECGVNTSRYRIALPDESGLANYFVQNCSSSENKSVVYLMFDSAITTSNQTVGYLYYNNPTADYYNGTRDAFLHYDDFDDASLNSTMWGNSNGAETGGYAYFTNNGNIYSKFNDSSTGGLRTVADVMLVGAASNELYSLIWDNATDSNLYGQFYVQAAGTTNYYKDIAGSQTVANGSVFATRNVLLHYDNRLFQNGSYQMWMNDTIEYQANDFVNDRNYYSYFAESFSNSDRWRLYDYKRMKYHVPNPVVYAGTEQLSVPQTSLKLGLYDEDYTDISNSTLSGQDFYVFANYTYDDNSSIITNDSAYCNYTALSIYDESYSSVSGSNSTVCLSGCDDVTKSVTFSGLHDEGFVSDTYRFKLCRNSAGTGNTFTISNNCSGSYVFGYNEIPYCLSGYVNFSVVDANCSAAQDFLLNITSDGATSAKGITLYDEFVGVDRLHDEIDRNMSFNDSLSAWTSDLHEYYTTGFNDIRVDCYYLGVVENETGTINISVGDVAPSIFIDTAWWWLLSDPVVFSAGLTGRYPVQSTFNVTGGCSDTDLFNAGAFLNFSNGSLILSEVYTAVNNNVPTSINFTQNNFSTNGSYLDGTLGYVFSAYCNDSNGNISRDSRSFTMKNDVPTASWSNSTVSIGSVPKVFNWSCSDAESESMTSYLFVNGTLNASGAISGFSFDFAAGVYDLNVSCADSYRNSSNDSITVTYVLGCVIDEVLLCDDCRYRDDDLAFQINCTNSVTPDSCHYSINKFSNVSISNCSGVVNFTAELGRNELVLTTMNGGLTTTETITFFAKKQGSTIWEFPVILFGILIVIGLIMLAGFTRIKVFYLLVGAAVVIIGVSLWALTWWLSVLLILAGVMTCLTTVMR